MNEVNKGGVGGVVAQRPSNLEPGGGERSKNRVRKASKKWFGDASDVNDAE